MIVPETRYAKTADGVHIAYQELGDGPIDLVFVPYDYSNVEVNWELPPYSSFVRSLAAHARVLMLDCRGVGCSDRSTGSSAPTLEAQMDDIRAVMDAARSERACLFGIESGATLCFPFAATYPDRVAAVVVFGATAAGCVAEDYPWGWTREEWEPWLDRVDREWASDTFIRDLMDWLSPSLAGDPEWYRTVGRVMRLSASPGDAQAHDRIHRDTDVRHVLPLIHAPTLVIHRTGDDVQPVEEGRYIAEQIPGATFLELPGNDHIWPLDNVVPHMARFLGSIRQQEAE